MGVFITIREKFGTLLIFVVALAILAFLLMDVSDSSSSMFGASTDNSVGSIGGEKVDYVSYQKKVNELTRNYELQNQGRKPDASSQQQIQNQAWQDLVNDQLFNEAADDLGLKVSKQELADMFQGQYPDDVVVQQFADPNTGQFNKAAVINYIQGEGQLEGEDKERWDSFKRFLAKKRKQDKYLNLTKKAIYVPSAFAKEQFTLSQSTVDLEYVYLPYAGVDDASVSVTDAELKAYIDENKGKYKREESRSVKFVSFEVLPTARDSSAALDRLSSDLDRFKNAKSDSLFVNAKSDDRFDYRYKKKSQMITSMADSLFSDEMEVGTVIGPILEKGSYKAIKFLGKRMVPDSVLVKHILLVPQTQEEVNTKRALADSLKQLIEDGVDFTKLSIDYSEDEKNKFGGGDLGWKNPGELAPNLDANAFYWKNEGDVFVGFSDQGYHVVQIVAAPATEEGVKTATFSRQIVALAETDREVFSKANKFASNNRSVEDFANAESDFTVQSAEDLKSSADLVPGLGSARGLVAWAFEAEKGQVADDIFTIDNKYVVAVLTDVTPGGTAPLDKVRAEVENAVKKQKKGEQIASGISDGSSLLDVAGSNGKEVGKASSLSLNNTFIPGVGLENGVIGKALTMNKDAKAVVKGNNGVLYIKVTGASRPADLNDASLQQRQLAASRRSSVDFSLPAALKEAANVEDQRYKSVSY